MDGNSNVNSNMNKCNLINNSKQFILIGNNSKENLGKNCNEDIKNNLNMNDRHGDKSSKRNESRKLVTLSSHTLNKDEISVLNKGLNFAIAPKRIPTESIICCIEDSIQHLESDEEKEAIRQDCVLILRRAKPPKNNMPKHELFALNKLKKNDNIVILKENNRDATIILNKESYIEKFKDHLNCGSYRKLDKNLISKFFKEVKKAIQGSNLDEKIGKNSSQQLR